MELVLFVGIQASGKSTFYKEVFSDTHLRISLDMLKTRHREKMLLRQCLELRQPVVIDNTNPSAAERLRYFEMVKAGPKPTFNVRGFYFESNIEDALRRNSLRQGKANIPEVGVRSTHRKLEIPHYEEGFDELHYVLLDPTVKPLPCSAQSRFIVSPWNSSPANNPHEVQRTGSTNASL